MIYQDPLAYLLGVEGIALLDAWAGDHDREFTEARLAEIRRLLDDEKLRGRGVLAERVSTATAYQQQAPGYDEEAGGGLFAADEPVVAECLSGREPGVALDAACGTGRFAEFLAGRGHRVIGVDSSPDMLARARRRVPGGEFRVGELDRLPLPDDSADVIVCALALVHVPRLQPVLAEFARVLRPGGDLVISDVHHERVTLGSVIKARGPEGEPRIAATYRHQLGDYLRAALSLGLQVKRCEEPAATGTGAPLPVPATEIGDWQYWPWSLLDYLPPAARVAGSGPSLVIWHFQLPATGPLASQQQGPPDDCGTAFATSSGYRWDMDGLADDLLLLTARPDGTLALSPKLRFGLSGAELVRLAAARRVDIVRGRIVILDTAPTGDPLLDEALASMTGGWHEPTAKAWVARNRRGLVERHLARAEEAGTVRAERGQRLGFIPVTRWLVVDIARAAQARARLEAIATSNGAVGPEQAALAGLAAATDVARVVFPGLGGASARKRLRQAARRERATADVTRAVDRAVNSAADASAAAVGAATSAAMDAAVSAATQAAVNAAVDAATQAAASAAADTSGGGGHHHHH